MLHPEFVEIVKLVKAENLVCRMTTNGTLLEQFAEQLVDVGLDVVTVSVDGPDHLHDAIRGVTGAHAKVTAGIRKLRELRRNAKPVLDATCVISDMDVDRLQECLRQLVDAGIDALSFQHLSFTTEQAGAAAN